MTKLMNKKQEIKNRIDLINKGEVPEGYKCCWGYFYPADWSIKKLKDLFNKVKTKNTDNNTLPVLTNSATQGVILQDEYFDREIVNDDNTDGYYIVEDGDFMYNPRISSNAPAGPINRNHLGKNGIASPLYTVFRAKRDKNIEFIENYFKSNYWHRYMKSVSNQGARHDRLNLTDDDFMNMPIPQPSEKEQEKIAEILSCCDKVIELKEELIKEKNKQKKYISNNLLLGKIKLKMYPNDYKKYKLKDVAIYQEGPGLRTWQFTSNGIKVINVTNIQQNGTLNIHNTNKYISIEEFNKSYKHFLIDKDDIVIASSGATYGKMAVVKEDDLPLMMNTSVIRFKVKDKIIYEYLKAFLGSDLLKKQIDLLITGSAQPNFGPYHLDRTYILVPTSISEQEKISKISEKLTKNIQVEENELEHYKQLKKSLSQLLLTGIVRVNEV